MGQKRRRKKTLLELLREADEVVRSTRLLVLWINRTAEESAAYIAHMPQRELRQ